MFGRVWTLSDLLGRVRMRSDAFGCVRMRLDAFGRFRKILEILRFWANFGDETLMFWEVLDETS